jgi:hypothetical protein
MKIAVLALSVVLLSSFAAPAEPQEADKKWLGAVQTMVAEGKTKVSTPSEARMTLLKEWGVKKGYAVQVTKNEAGFTVELKRRGEVASVQ